MSTFGWVTQLIYVLAASCFVLGLHLMNNPATARRGNQVSVTGMVIRSEEHTSELQSRP